MATPVSGRRERKKQGTRTLLLDTAQRLFAERGFAGTSIQVIARTADVADQTVFNHFPRKAELFFEGRCPWWRLSAVVLPRLAVEGCRPGDLEVVDALVTAIDGHVEYLRTGAATRTVEDLAVDAGLQSWEREAQARVEAVLGKVLTTPAAGGPRLVDPERVAARMVLEARLTVEGVRRSVRRGVQEPDRPPLRSRLRSCFAG